MTGYGYQINRPSNRERIQAIRSWVMPRLYLAQPNLVQILSSRVPRTTCPSGIIQGGPGPRPVTGAAIEFDRMYSLVVKVTSDPVAVTLVQLQGGFHRAPVHGKGASRMEPAP